MGLDISGFGSVADMLGKVVDKAWPDPADKAKAQLAVLQMQQAGEFKAMDTDLQLAQMQADINRAEAASSSTFTSGWRPFIGWVCGSALATEYLANPLLTWVGALAGTAVGFPHIPLDALLALLVPMLGLGGLRTYEKIKGVTK